MRLTTKQLIASAYQAARYLPLASCQLMRELATRLDVARVALSESLEQQKFLMAERDSAIASEKLWESEMKKVIGTENVDDVVIAIGKLKAHAHIDHDSGCESVSANVWPFCAGKRKN
ncbi:hypothetical protein [Atlantibacter hermannii]|uniref:hypothetical protein n=1 Tax=Atlantibacter hermannii TaxID=565 RepID=UPI002899CD5F|nr:hypothetical protein [Atlantibacter hermannii]